MRTQLVNLFDRGWLQHSTASEFPLAVGCQLAWNVVPFGLQGSSQPLMRVMNQALAIGLGIAPAA